MKSFKEYVNEAKLDSNYYVELDIENTEVLYQAAMRTKTAADLKKKMISMKPKFKDLDKIDMAKVNWETVYSNINENINESAAKDKLYDWVGKDSDNEVKLWDYAAEFGIYHDAKEIDGIDDLIDALEKKKAIKSFLKSNK